MNKNMMVLVAVILIVVAAAGGFYAGLQYQKSQRGTQFAGRSGANGQGFAGRFGGANGANFSPVRGQILSISDNSITVKQLDGTTKIVVVSSTTAFANTQKAAKTDLKTGDNVMVVGTTNSDGSVTASNVSINPQAFRPSTTPASGK
jgi:pectate lyase